ncbi:hypothetical protein [Micromonospora thermarum]|uniref:Uncharacterized protein n=1 Tax=Micromonospora thermarum TaxID=2720024 RepID=A0ABX0Z7H9_9ACTN|nr:hypothetical protein [Micromonospora thermarum]NJP31895.1 hypothetical protein [Micromonospora thermarum]
MTDIHVNVDQPPEPGLLRAAIEAALAGRAWPDGPEAAVARAVADHVTGTDHGPRSRPC